MLLPEIGEARFEATHTVTTHEGCYFHEAEKKVNAEKFCIAQVEPRAPDGRYFLSIPRRPTLGYRHTEATHEDVKTSCANDVRSLERAHITQAVRRVAVLSESLRVLRRGRVPAKILEVMQEVCNVLDSVNEPGTIDLDLGNTLN